MRKPAAKNNQIVLIFDLMEANELLSKRNKSQYQQNHSLVLYQRVYKGNGVRLLMSRSRVLKKWMVSYTTYGVDRDTKAECQSHYMQLVLDEKTTLSKAATICGQYWSKHICPEVDKLKIDVTKIQVTIRSYTDK